MKKWLVLIFIVLLSASWAVAETTYPVEVKRIVNCKIYYPSTCVEDPYIGPEYDRGVLPKIAGTLICTQPNGSKARTYMRIPHLEDGKKTMYVYTYLPHSDYFMVCDTPESVDPIETPVIVPFEDDAQ